MVTSGAGWRGTGTVVDPAHSTRVPKGAFMVDHALKPHWDGTKEETGAYLITGLGPATNIEIPKESGPYRGGDPRPPPSKCQTRSSGKTTAAT